MNKSEWLRAREHPTWRVRDLMEENAKLRDVLDAWSKASWFAGVPAVPDSNDPLEALLYRTREALK